MYINQVPCGHSRASMYEIKNDDSTKNSETSEIDPSKMNKLTE